jgi:hypothetical protein
MAATTMTISTAATAEDTFQYKLLPANPCTFNGRPCGPATVLSSDEQACLAGGGNLAFGKTTTCWTRAGAKSTPVGKLTEADHKTIDGCVGSNQSVGYQGGRLACVGTPAEVTKGSIPAPLKIGPPGTAGNEHTCPPNCLKATETAPAIPAKQR